MGQSLSSPLRFQSRSSPCSSLSSSFRGSSSSEMQPTRPQHLQALIEPGPSLGAQQRTQQAASFMQPPTSSVTGSSVGAPLRGVPCNATGQVASLQGNLVGSFGHADCQSAMRQAHSQLQTVHGPHNQVSCGLGSGLKQMPPR